ncbi:uncharacterized protein B0I36DRAFT_332616 [Microdochium trichocladiopsis]|uniref:CFEM domain-containing protein n=1 Tax=Microdochium trichocladiopsis TaxID=1682393 RepID=A0A9P8XYJ1_9PEZI|nr:uncharacterized protein B0I36DRAFT_332616 [Microdochium trichocladiopsis]KAH7025173.1 hypothetical protein B0I36DRAFT_332616 [Microdochium trichocladiopsis]
MRSLAAVVALLSAMGLVAAQLPPGTPKCAVPCYIKGAAASPCLTDVACLCADQTFIASVETCVRASCIVEDALLVKNASATTCGIEPGNISPLYVETSAIMTGFALFFTILRVVYRQWITQLGLGADDWTTIAAALSCIPATVLNARLAQFGIGKDIWTLTPYQITMFGQTFYILTMIYFLDMALLKLSILFFFLRIFPDRRFRTVVWVTVGVVTMFGVAYVMAAALQCLPVSYNWTRWNDRENQGHCVDYGAIAWANAAVSIALDFWMLYLPLSQISSLKLDWRKKVGISAMFIVGTFVTVVSIIRLASIIKFRSSDNITHDTTAIAMWSTVEICTGVICACMPSMRLVLGRLWPNVFGSPATTSSSLYPRGGGMYYGKNNTGTGTGTGLHNGSHHNNHNTTTSKSAQSTTTKSINRFSRPMSFFSSHQSGNSGSSGGRVDAVAYPGRLGRVGSTEDDAIQLRTNPGQPLPPVYMAERSSTSSSELDLPRQGTSSGGIHVTRSVEIKY